MRPQTPGNRFLLLETEFKKLTKFLNQAFFYRLWTDCAFMSDFSDVNSVSRPIFQG